MNTFESYLSESPTINKWVYDLNYGHHALLRERGISQLKYTTGDGVSLILRAVMKKGNVEDIDFICEYKGHENLFDKWEANFGVSFKYSDLIKWLKTNKDVQHIHLHVYSYPTEAQFEQLINPVLSS